jgi:predicted transcriptional regulator of viral defense system
LSSSDPIPAGQAARALARSGLSVIRIPDDLQTLHRHGFPMQSSQSALQMLVRLGLLRPIARGLYEVRDPAGVSQSSFEALLGSWFRGGPHLATGWWALAQAHLTTQEVREVVVLTETNRRSVFVLGRRVRVAKVGRDDLWGGRQRRTGLILARPERALCDCVATRPARIPAARTAEALDGFLKVDEHALERLVRAARRFDSPVVARRLGFLVDVVAGPEAAAPFLPLIGASKKPDALEPGDAAAPIINKWQVRTALSVDDLLEHRRVS